MKNQLTNQHVKPFLALLGLVAALGGTLPVAAQNKQAKSQAETCEAVFSKSHEIEAYLQEHRAAVAGGKKKFIAQKLNFTGVEGRDVYNPATPFTTTYRGKKIDVLMARVEPRENHESEVWFFTEISPNTYAPIEGMPKLIMEDPFWTEINGEIVTGGVQTWPDPLNPGMLAYGTVFFRDFGKGLEFLGRENGEADSTLTPFAKGPERMKDIRLLDMKDGRILVATRPQSEKLSEGGRGRVGLVYIKSLDELTPAKMNQAKIIQGQVANDEWIGVNQMHLLANGDVEFVAHVARYDLTQEVRVGDKDVNPRDYYGVTFTLSNLCPRLSMERRNVDNMLGSSKRNDLVNVTFNGGRTQNTYFLGLGDAEAYKLTIIEED